MAQRHEIEAWVNPAAWDDKDEAERVIDAIEEADTDNEAEWVRIAHGGSLDILAAEAREYDKASQAAEDARIRLQESVRSAHAGGASKTAIHEATGVSRPTIDKWLSSGL